MKINEPRPAARRALAPEQDVEPDVVEASIATPSRRGRARLSRTAVAAVAAGSVAAAAVFGWAWSSRSADESVSEVIATDAAVPESAARAVENGFPTNEEDASRSAIRSNLDTAMADQAAKEHEEDLDSTYNDSTSNIATETAAEREAKMDADLELVAAQEEKIKAEKQAAAERLAAAEAALKKQGVDTSKISKEDLNAAGSKGGALPLKPGTFRMGPHYRQHGIWARYHTGQDFTAPKGTEIYAAASGIVISPTSAGWAGTNVVISHSNGGSTLYAHMSRSVVKPGQSVKAGDLIGYVGSSGRSTGPHLHFEYYPKGTTPGKVYEAGDPMAFLRSLGVNA
ncbi:M23 family metallopeptidase [Arachnia propionica]|uniref:M23 family metallopeptidase n=1 Tax=Arachnia propionica TaxID=1750 RepID=A0A3P1TBP0_9ACTN|nr:M23 family metallopeptidase [Arachnia propionica]MDO5082075.1 M23 family metallopeptidase [Arachnia propionica]RRD06625.1 M23 family metallopeptidase [Arachnia propionica]